jgi:hypothetical protein
MNNLNDNNRDEVGELLDRGYASDPVDGFAASLLGRLQESIKPHPRRQRPIGAAIAASAAILLGLAAIIYCLHTGESDPDIVEAPIEKVAPLVVRGQILKWDAPIAEFAVTEVISGKSNTAAVLYVNLSTDMDAIRQYVRQGLPKEALAAMTDDDLSARAATLFTTQLNMAARTNLVLELEPRSSGCLSESPGRILSWAGIPDLPPRDQHYDMNKTIINVVDNGSAATRRPHADNFLRDEWGMPR